jgi:hypothetical protein
MSVIQLHDMVFIVYASVSISTENTVSFVLLRYQEISVAILLSYPSWQSSFHGRCEVEIECMIRARLLVV